MSLLLRQVKGSPLTISEMDGNLTYLNDQSLVKNAVVSSVSIGAINAGDTIPFNTNLQDFVVQLLSKTYEPTFTDPSFLISNDQGSLREINDVVNITLTFFYNRGSINGNLILGVWDSVAIQNFRGGEASSYTINGITGSSNIITVSNHTVTQGMNTFTGSVTYGNGPQPLDSLLSPFNSPYPGGTSPNVSTSFEGVYPLFATTLIINTATKQGLYSMISGNNIEIDLVAESGGNKQFFDIPTTWLSSRNLSGVYYFNVVSNMYDSSNKIGDFSVTNVNQIIQGLGVPYKRYTNIKPNRGPIKIKLVF